jgi:hypothetical protein
MVWPKLDEQAWWGFAWSAISRRGPANHEA